MESYNFPELTFPERVSSTPSYAWGILSDSSNIYDVVREHNYFLKTNELRPFAGI